MATVLQGYLAGYRSTVASLLARTRELESREYPTKLSNTLLSVVKGAVEASSKVVEEAYSDGADGLEVLIVRHSQFLEALHQIVHLVGQSVGSDVPRWAIAPMKAEIAKYIPSSADIIIASSEVGGNFDYDYSLRGLEEFLAAALGKEIADDLVRDLPEHIAVFHFPFGERDNVISHGAFFHEVGHQIDIGIRSISDRVTGQYLAKIDKDIRKTVDDAVSSLLTRGEDEQRSLGDEEVAIFAELCVKAIQQTLDSWGKEFCADSLATRILGPAYALTIVVLPALLRMAETHASTHPATLLRLRTVLSLLSEPKAGDFFGEAKTSLHEAGVLELLDEWKERTVAKDPAQFRWGSPLHPLAPDSLQVHAAKWGIELAGLIVEAVVAETKDQGYYSPQQYKDDIRELLATLKRGITINERVDYKLRTHTENSIATIFNVGVSCYLTEEKPEGRARLSSLMRKSIELSHIQRTLKQVSSGVTP